MNTATRITTTMVVALAMIGMLSGIGAAIPPTTTMDYNVNFDGSGDGNFNIWTNTPVGNDFMGVHWTNSAANGHQDAYSADGWTEINRDATITGTLGDDIARGSIYTESDMLSGDYTPASVTAYAGYYDSSPNTSYIHLVQNTLLEGSDTTPDTGCDGIGTGVTIHGYAYGNDSTHVSGSVSSVTDGTDNASTEIGAYVHNGNMNMVVGSGIMDDRGNNEESGTIYNATIRYTGSSSEGAIWGNALIGGVPQYPVENNTLYMDFSGKVNVTADGNFIALTSGMPGTWCIGQMLDGGMLSVLPPGLVPR